MITCREKLLEAIRAERKLQEKKRLALGPFSRYRIERMTPAELANLRQLAESLPESKIREELLERLMVAA